MDTRPTFSEFKRLAERGNLIPCHQELLWDTETPVSTYLKLGDKAFSYLLESAEAATHWGRYSIIGYKPYLTVCFRNGRGEIQRGQAQEIIKTAENPLHTIRRLIRQLRPITPWTTPRFQGGFVGYVNYELVRKWEPVLDLVQGDNSQPEGLFTASRRLIIFDHLRHVIKVVAFAHTTDHTDLRDAYERTCQEIEDTISEMRQPLSSIAGEPPLSCSELQSNLSREAFEAAVRKAKEYEETLNKAHAIFSALKKGGKR